MSNSGHQYQKWKSNYEAARLELKRAEELLIQRHENTRKILEKQKSLQNELAMEKELRKKSERDTKKYRSDNQRLMKKMSLLEDEIRSLKVTVTKLKGERNLSNGDTSLPEPRRRTTSAQTKHQPLLISVPQKRAVSSSATTRGYQGNGTETNTLQQQEQEPSDTASKLREMLMNLISGDIITNERIKMVASIVKSTGLGWNQSAIVSVAYDALQACCRESPAPILAPLTWAPCSWFPETSCTNRKRKKSLVRYHGIPNPDLLSSIVIMWCDQKALEQNAIPWLLKCIQRIDQDSPRGLNITKDLTLKSYDATLHAIESHSANVTAICCSATVTMALLRCDNDIHSAATFVVDILASLPSCTTIEKHHKILIALTAAAEVWPAALDRRAIGDDLFWHLRALVDKYSSGPSSGEDTSIEYMMCYYATAIIHALLPDRIYE